MLINIYLCLYYVVKYWPVLTNIYYPCIEVRTCVQIPALTCMPRNRVIQFIWYPCSIYDSQADGCAAPSISLVDPGKQSAREARADPCVCSPPSLTSVPSQPRTKEVLIKFSKSVPVAGNTAQTVFPRNLHEQCFPDSIITGSKIRDRGAC